MRESALYRRLSTGQTAAAGVVLLGLTLGLLIDPERTLAGIVILLAVLYIASSAWKVGLVLCPRPPCPDADGGVDLPRYTVLTALYDEARVMEQLVGRLAAISYPADRLEGFLVLEAHDAATIEAAERAHKPPWLKILIVPPGCPQTKPRALNVALEAATGDLLTVYDAEDEPDPMQLREAAAAYAADRTGRIACLQAPLRIRRRRTARTTTPFLDRQFAAEYAALFEVALPAMARLGLPFPLGGTSNHFRVDVLREVGGWDSWNVTEDADLGFRLWRRGWRLGVLRRPTLECPPGPFQAWLPQRTRWLKGYMQTWGVHTRDVRGLGLTGAFALASTVGVALASAMIHAPSLAWLLATAIATTVLGVDLQASLLALAVLATGTGAAWLGCVIGARRAGVAYGAGDMLLAPFYWAILSVAFANAAWRLAKEPFFWDKTPHEPDDATAGVLDEAAPVGLSAGHAAAPEPVA